MNNPPQKKIKIAKFKEPISTFGISSSWVASPACNSATQGFKALVEGKDN
jgi:hypothetical protein